jgi:UDP-N-acetylglucosamine 2-epimerase
MATNSKPRIAIVFGIRPDLIRAALILRRLQLEARDQVVFIWSGQHYSDNLKDVFLRELDIDPPDIELGATGETDAEVVASVVSKLYPVLEKLRPAATVFLGDTNTVMGSIAAGMLNIPVVHIEGAMRSYDWRMPEEKYRTVIDHLSDVIYAYYPEYKEQAISEGLNPNNVVVVQNLIVDVLENYYFARKEYFEQMISGSFFEDRGIERSEYFLMTCHRRENVEIAEVLKNILAFLAELPYAVYFPASYRTQRNLATFGFEVPKNVMVVDPIGYEELLALLVNSRGAITDSGTIVEETAVLGVPSLQLRRATERPQVYDVGSSVKFDPSRPGDYPAETLIRKLESLRGKTFDHRLGDGKASDRIVDDLLRRLREDDFAGHRPENHHLRKHVERSYREDGLPDPS